jgi:hypothetical protein
VPTEDVKVSVLLPATGLRLEKRVKVDAGKTVDVTFDLQFELAQYRAALELGKREEQGEKGSAETTAEPH